MGAPQGDTLGRMNPLSRSSCNCSFNSFSSSGAIWYGALDIGLVPDNKSMVNSISLSGGNPGSSYGNTSTKSRTIGIPSSIASGASFVTHTKNPEHPCFKSRVACIADTSLGKLKPIFP